MNKSFCSVPIRLVIFLSLVSFFPLKAQSIITGVASAGGDPSPGCTTRIIQDNTTQITDVDGRFAMQTGALKNLSLELVCWPYTCKVVIDEIPVDAAKIELGTIPLFYNLVVEVAEYEKLSEDEKKNCVPTYHWVQLLGYFNTTKCDTVQVRNELHVKKGIKYRLDSLNNTVVIHYKDWKR